MSKNAYLTAYKASSKGAKHRAARIARHLKDHPNDEQTAKAAAKQYKHRAKPKGNKVPFKALGTQEVGPNTWTYVAEVNALPGHPVLAMLKTNMDKARKFRNGAILSEDFIAAYL
jgi:hypothetical protein